MPDVKKLTFIVTHSDDDPELATIPFMLATGSMAMGIQPVVMLQSKGVMIALRGFASHIHFEKANPLKDLVDVYIEAGFKLLVCSPCMEKRKMKQDDLIDGALVVGAARMIEEISGSNHVLRY